MVIIVPLGPSLYSLQSAFPFTGLPCVSGSGVWRDCQPSSMVKGTKAQERQPIITATHLLIPQRRVVERHFPLAGVFFQLAACGCQNLPRTNLGSLMKSSWDLLPTPAPAGSLPFSPPYTQLSWTPAGLHSLTGPLPGAVPAPPLLSFPSSPALDPGRLGRRTTLSRRLLQASSVLPSQSDSRTFSPRLEVKVDYPLTEIEGCVDLDGIAGGFTEDSGMKGWRTEAWAGLGRISNGW